MVVNVLCSLDVAVNKMSLSDGRRRGGKDVGHKSNKYIGIIASK